MSHYSACFERVMAFTTKSLPISNIEEKREISMHDIKHQN